MIPFRAMLIPIEIKSGPIGKLRSLHQFMEQFPHRYAIRLYAGGVEINQVKTPTGKTFQLLSLPYFLGAKLEVYLQWFIRNAAL